MYVQSFSITAQCSVEKFDVIGKKIETETKISLRSYYRRKHNPGNKSVLFKNVLFFSYFRGVRTLLMIKIDIIYVPTLRNEIELPPRCFFRNRFIFTSDTGGLFFLILLKYDSFFFRYGYKIQYNALSKPGRTEINVSKERGHSNHLFWKVLRSFPFLFLLDK